MRAASTSSRSSYFPEWYGEGVDIDHQIGAVGSQLGHGPIGGPQVFTDRQAHACAGNRVEFTGRSWLEPAVLVEHAVGGKLDLCSHADYPAGGADRSGVHQARSSWLGEADDSRAAIGVRGDLLDGRDVVTHKSRLEQQILRGIAGHCQLGENDQVTGLGGAAGNGVDDATGVALDVPDGEVELAESQAQVRHVQKATDQPGAARRWRGTLLAVDDYGAAAYPDAAAAFVDEVTTADPALGPRLSSEPELFRGLIGLSDASRSLTAAVLRDPTVLQQIDLVGESDPEHLLTEARASVRRAAIRPKVRTALRIWKQQQLLRIALRDLAGLADLPAVGRELSALADACLDAALAQADPQVPLAVLGNGEAGGLRAQLFVRRGHRVGSRRRAG